MVTPRIKIHKSDPSLGKSTETVQQSEQVNEPYRMMFEELKEKNKQRTSLCCCKEKKEKNLLWGGGSHYLWVFTLCGS
jgi:hypothetical protein